MRYNCGAAAASIAVAVSCDILETALWPTEGSYGVDFGCA